MPESDKSVRDSGIKQDWSGILIGLERDLLPIPSPDPSLTLRPGDLLWVMGPQKMAAKLVSLGLLDCPRKRAFPEGEGAPVRTLGRMRATSQIEGVPVKR